MTYEILSAISHTLTSDIPVTVSVHNWLGVLILAGTVSAAVGTLWRMWVRPVVRWCIARGEEHTMLVEMMMKEIPDIKKAVEHSDNRWREHDQLWPRGH